MDLFRPDNPVFAGYAFYSALLVFKMILMSYLTGFTRFRKKANVVEPDTIIGATKSNLVIRILKTALKLNIILTGLSIVHFVFKKAFVNSEDAASAGVETKVDDEEVERIRRAHLNDMENIPIFIGSALIFVATDPNVIFALMLFRIYALARILHTVVYVLMVRQPARAVCFSIGALTNIVIVFCIFASCLQM